MAPKYLSGRAPSGAADPPEAWFRLAVSVVLGTIGAVGMWSVVVVLPAVQAEFGVDRADASLPYTLTMIGFALGNFGAGRYVDRYGITLPMMVAAVGLSAGFASAAASTTIWQFALIQGLVIGLATAVCFGPLIADISHWFRRRRGLAVAAAASGNYMAGAVWPPIIQALIQVEDWRFAYFIIAVTCIVTMVPLALLLRRRAPRTVPVTAANGIGASDQPQPIDLSPRTLQVLLSIAGLGCCVAMSMPQVHIVAYCADLGYGIARGAEMLSLMLLGGVASRLVSGALADYIGGVRTLLLGSVLQGLSLLLYIPFNGLASLYIVSLVFGLSQGGIVPSYAIIVREYLPAREAGRRIGFIVMMTVFGMGLGGWLSGWIYDLTGSYQAAFLNGIAWNLLNVTIMLMVLWRSRTPAAAAA